MIIKKPSIFIYTHEADPSVLKEVCAGIEEEAFSTTSRNFQMNVWSSLLLKQPGTPCSVPVSVSSALPSA